jgi:hypothetical protein
MLSGMRRWSGWCVVVVVVAACGSGGSAKRHPDAGADAPIDTRAVDASVDARLIDARLIDARLIDARSIDAGLDAPSVCNVLAQTGCGTGEKCTWIIDTASPSPLGHIGCAPDGAAAVGSACTRNPPGATGYDDCVKGNYCFGPDSGGAGVCKAICDPAGGTPMCTSGYACSTYDGLFGPSGQPPAAGVCVPQCDPIADNNFLGSNGNDRTGTVCGSAGSAAGSGFLYSNGCYGYPDGSFGVTTWTCAGQVNYSRVHRATCDNTVHAGDLATCAAFSSSVYINGCASGYEPMFYDAEGATTIDCIALCRPATCKNDAAAGAAYPGTPNCGTAGSASMNIRGNPSGHDCTSTKVQYVSFQDTPYAWPGTSGSASMALYDGEQCFYSWLFEFDSANNFIQSSTSDTVGFCVDHSKYRYDPTGGSNMTTVWPRCDQIGLGSAGYGATAFSDAISFGCVDTTTARAAGELMFAGKPTLHRPELRLPYHTGAKLPF